MESRLIGSVAFHLYNQIFKKSYQLGQLKKMSSNLGQELWLKVSSNMEQKVCCFSWTLESTIVLSALSKLTPFCACFVRWGPMHCLPSFFFWSISLTRTCCECKFTTGWLAKNQFLIHNITTLVINRNN